MPRKRSKASLYWSIERFQIDLFEDPEWDSYVLCIVLVGLVLYSKTCLKGTTHSEDTLWSSGEAGAVVTPGHH